MLSIETKSPKDLWPHTLLEDLHEWQEDSPAMQALVEDVRCRGIDHPLIVTPDNRIVDGRQRWRAALALDLPQAPVQIVDESRAPMIILGNLTQRRHYSPAALAYLAIPLLEETLEESRVRRLENTDPNGALDALLAGLSSEELARRLGLDAEALATARRLRSLLETHDETRGWIEPWLLEGRIDLERALTLAREAQTNPRPPKEAASPLEDVRQDWDHFAERARIVSRHWEALEPGERPQAETMVSEALLGLCPDLRRTIHRLLEESEGESAEW